MSNFVDNKTKQLNRKLRFGLPKGNLNKPDENRGFTKFLFELAGYKIEGYEPGKEEQFPRVKQLDEVMEFVCVKPNQFPFMLEEGVIDLAIFGRDLEEESNSRYWQQYNWANPMSAKESYRAHRFPRCLLPILDNDVELSRQLGKLRLNFDFLASEDKLGFIEQRMQDVEFKDSDKRKLLKLLGERIINWKRVERIFMRKRHLNPAVERELSREEPGIKSFSFPLDLGYGKVDVFWGAREDSRFVPCGGGKAVAGLKDSRIATSYPNLVYRELCLHIPSSMIKISRTSSGGSWEEYLPFVSTSLDYVEREVHPNMLHGPFNDKINFITKDEAKVVILPLGSSTALMQKRGLARLIVDCVSSGNDFNRNGIVKLGRPIIANSTANLYLHGSLASDYCEIYHNKNADGKIITDIINGLVGNLKRASLEYGKTRKDSIYYGGDK